MRSSQILLLFLLVLIGEIVFAAPGIESIALRLRKLNKATRVLMVGSHPDDEDSSLLARLALQDGVRVWYLSLSRGEGGQNRIGDEKGVALGVVRTGELLAARRIDGAEQLLGPFIDFGFSKTAEETFERWGRKRMVECIVQAIRQTRCDLVLSCWRGESSDGHGHHIATGLATIEAFKKAGDSDAFPKVWSPWKPLRLMARFRPSKDTPGGASQWGGHDVDFDVGKWDRVLGRSPHEVAMEGRSLHRSQDMGALQDKGARFVGYSCLEGERPAFGTKERPILGTVRENPLQGVHFSLLGWIRRYCGEDEPAMSPVRLEEFERILEELELKIRGPGLATDVYVNDDLLVKAIKLLREEQVFWRASAAPCASFVSERIGDSLRTLESIWLDVAGVTLEAVTDQPDISPGETLRVQLHMARRGGEHAQLYSMQGVGCLTVEMALNGVPEGRWPLPSTLEPAGALDIKIPEDGNLAVCDSALPWTWLGRDRFRYQFVVPLRSLYPRANLAARLRCTIETVDFTPMTFERPVEYRRVDPGYGEIRRPLRVLPALTLEAAPTLHVLRRGTKTKPVTTFTVRSHRAGSKSAGVALVRYVDKREVRSELELDGAVLDAEGASQTIRKELDVDLGQAGSYQWGAQWIGGESDRQSARRLQEIRYPHIEEFDLLEPVNVRVIVVDCKVPEGLSVGYVPGTGDDLPAALKSLGVDVEVLDANAVAFDDLSRFDSVVIGIRALEVRDELVPHRERLWGYARNGGTLIVQYHKPRKDGASRFVPFDGAFMKRPAPRVTDETAEVTIIDPDDPLMTTPNKLTAADFEGWVQERGLYFLERWPAELKPLLGSHDKNESRRDGGLVRGKLGKGQYVYCAYALFRQLPAGVPGAYRLLANLVSLSADR